MNDLHLESMLSRWNERIMKSSGNLTTNSYLSLELKEKLLTENYNLINDLNFEEISFPFLSSELHYIKDINILAGLQKLNKKENLTVFRAIRFPTVNRIWETVSDLGLSMPNYEQERILQLYENNDYIKKREMIQKDSLFQTQAQERVVDGVPVFNLVNDALQIHRAYRSEEDRLLLIGIHIPYDLFQNGDLKLIANTAIDLDYSNSERDFEITNFKEKNGYPVIDYHALRVRGIDLHEMYIKGLSYTLEGHKKLGIEQKFFLLDIYRSDIDSLGMFDIDSEVLKENEYFLHGFFGDQNVFGRRPTEYLPSKCWEVKLK